MFALPMEMLFQWIYTARKHKISPYDHAIHPSRFGHNL